MLHKDFNLFFATGSKQFLEFLLLMDVKNILISFAYPGAWKMKGLLHRNNVTLLCDSGAFTAWNLCQKKKREGDKNWERHAIKREDYLAFMNEHKDIIWEAVNLDVIPGNQGSVPTPEEVASAAQEGWENYLWFKENGWDTIHVYHEGEPVEILNRMLDECRYIGISPNNDHNDNKKQDWLDMTFRHIMKYDYSKNDNVKDGEIIKTHGFGVTSKQLVERFPWYSCDSSSFSLTAAMGSVLSPWGRLYISDQGFDDPDHISHKSPEVQALIEKYLMDNLGFGIKSMTETSKMIDTPCPECKAVVRTPERNAAYKARNYANILYYSDLEKERQKNGPTNHFMKQQTLL